MTPAMGFGALVVVVLTAIILIRYIRILMGRD